MQVEIRTFEELSKQELYELLKLRAEIFVVEQDCVYNDLDNRDQYAIHVLGKQNEEIVAYSRILPENTRFKEMSIGRVVVSSSQRGKNLGKEIMNECINYIYNELMDSDKQIRISAQCYLNKFYAELGFITVSNEYMEDGIPHVEMIYRKSKKDA